MSQAIAIKLFLVAVLAICSNASVPPPDHAFLFDADEDSSLIVEAGLAMNFRSWAACGQSHAGADFNTA